MVISNLKPVSCKHRLGHHPAAHLMLHPVAHHHLVFEPDERIFGPDVKQKPSHNVSVRILTNRKTHHKIALFFSPRQAVYDYGLMDGPSLVIVLQIIIPFTSRSMCCSEVTWVVGWLSGMKSQLKIGRGTNPSFKNGKWSWKVVIQNTVCHNSLL